MANYQITARNNEGMPLVAVSIGSIDQEGQVVSDMVIVNAVRDALAGVAGVESVVKRKFEQVITIV
ncbi:hypothetical protein [Streptomyces griseorubiginosus]|uniref:hypothetical protein n=1 Tax=Streptomyces griseorubiginosus TaxID=67304 RepID=UPI0036E9E9ED